MRLWEKFWPTFQPGAVYSYPYELEMNTRRIVTRMEINGARVDVDYSQEKYDELLQYTDQVRAWGESTYNGMSIGSNQQLVAQFEKLGAEITERTATGRKSASAEQLQLLSINGNPEVKQLADTA
jgi:hypothetical protein